MKDRPRVLLAVVFSAVLGAAGCGGGSGVAFKELLDPDPQVRTDAAQRLGASRSEEAVDSLMAILDDDSEMVRVQAVRSLGKIGAPRAVPALNQKAEDPLSTVRLQVSLALGEIADPGAIPALRKLLYDENGATRLAAARSLGTIGTPESLRVLMEVAMFDEDEMVRRHVVEVIGNHQLRDAIPLLESNLTSEEDLIRAKSAEVLGMLADESSVPVLIEALDDPYFKTRSLAAHALSKVGAADPAVLGAVGSRLEIEKHPMTRVDLAWVLARLGDRSQLGIIRELLIRGDPEDVRAEAARALGEVGDQTDLPRLEKAAKDKKGLVRKEASAAFQRLKEA